MSDTVSVDQTELRKLGRRDIPAATAHLLRLDPDNRRLRFGSYVSDGFIREYTGRLSGMDTVVFGAFIDGTLRAIGELHGLRRSWPARAEAALSVEPDWQNRGIGSKLFARLVTVAQNRGIRSLHVLFLHENRRMRRITRKHDAKLEFFGEDIEATLDPPLATALSLAREFAEDSLASMRGMLRPVG